MKATEIGNATVRFKAEVDVDGRYLTKLHLKSLDPQKLLKVTKVTFARSAVPIVSNVLLPVEEPNKLTCSRKYSLVVHEYASCRRRCSRCRVRRTPRSCCCITASASWTCSAPRSTRSSAQFKYSIILAYTQCTCT